MGWVYQILGLELRENIHLLVSSPLPSISIRTITSIVFVLAVVRSDLRLRNLRRLQFLLVVGSTIHS